MKNESSLNNVAISHRKQDMGKVFRMTTMYKLIPEGFLLTKTDRQNYEVPMYCRASRRNKKHLCTLNLNEASEIYLYPYVHLTLLTTTINTELI